MVGRGWFVSPQGKGSLPPSRPDSWDVFYHSRRSESCGSKRRGSHQPAVVCHWTPFPVQSLMMEKQLLSSSFYFRCRRYSEPTIHPTVPCMFLASIRPIEGIITGGQASKAPCHQQCQLEVLRRGSLYCGSSGAVADGVFT